MIKQVCVAGAGTMGSGIALNAAQFGYNAILFDVNESVLQKAKYSNEKILQSAVEKGKIKQQEKEDILSRILYINEINQCKAGLIIEAIVERIDIKTSLFKQLADINSEHCILASNTSSLSINALQKEINHPGRFAGLHFFNPAHLMKLVEVVRGENTKEIGRAHV